MLMLSIEPPSVNMRSTCPAISGDMSVSMVSPQMERKRPPSTAKLTRIPPDAGRQR